jgi:hypothetical protein
MRLLLPLLILCCFSTCKRDAPPQDAPEHALRQYQAYIDNNQYDEAIAMSTPAEQQRLAREARLMQLEPDSSLLHTTFLSIQCTEILDTAYCACQLNDAYGAYEARYRLVKIKQYWQMDTPPGDQTGPIQ